LRIFVNRVEEGFVVGNLFCKFRTLRVNRMSFCEAAASSSCKVSSVTSFLFFGLLGFLWVRVEQGSKAGSARW